LYAKPAGAFRFEPPGRMDPCPCGFLGHPTWECVCPPELVARYRSRLSGRLLARVDLRVAVPAVPLDDLAATPVGEGSAAMRARVEVARKRQVERYADIYTSRVANFRYQTPFVYLRSPRGSLPHDDVAERWAVADAHEPLS